MRGHSHDTVATQMDAELDGCLLQSAILFDFVLLDSRKLVFVNITICKTAEKSSNFQAQCI